MPYTRIFFRPQNRHYSTVGGCVIIFIHLLLSVIPNSIPINQIMCFPAATFNAFKEHFVNFCIYVIKYLIIPRLHYTPTNLYTDFAANVTAL